VRLAESFWASTGATLKRGKLPTNILLNVELEASLNTGPPGDVRIIFDSEKEIRKGGGGARINEQDATVLRGQQVKSM